MPVKVNPQEIYLLERYSSLAYFGELRDTWEKVVKHVESCLQYYLSDLPANYRSMPLPAQADIVWEERILPNFRHTLQSLYTGFIELSHGDISALEYANGPVNDVIGQRRDYSPDWMSKEDQEIYEKLLMKAATMAGYLTGTSGAYWRPLDLSNYSSEFEPFDSPARWPLYRINQKISVRSGIKTPQNGIYVPDLDNSCAQFLSTYYNEAPQTVVIVGYRDLLDLRTREKYGEEPILEKKDCTWYLVERASDSDSAQQVEHSKSSQLKRVTGGQPCPEDGYYFTPARADSRRLFKRGEMMPDLGANYGVKIGQWDVKQE
ncbi:hypothetical protein ACFQ09_25205 [Massilia norwichensis]|uniref:Tn7 transposase TnsA N-terminal domain-containing protein n=1 Tax=Massilia norwichensis TaxID=1442366 RepID=A0ABT2ACZ2_9BURK|nr:Tn7 transposase TnsA N-terminal domain-containing protein [Massilia norwichensis]MCS0591645.1 Tn7 transposase TnsA N-terminal domain-containing protein [Massilia norwichensis]